MPRNAPKLLAPLALIGETTITVLTRLGSMFLFFLESFGLIFTSFSQIPKAVRQTYFIGVRSISVILLIGLFTGMVMGLQTYYALSKFGSEGFLGAAVALSLVRELGPVLTAIMITGRAGSSMTAEIGVMRISDQIDALEVMGVNPVRYLVSPKLTACLISFPILTTFFDLIGILGGYVSGVALMGGNAGVYIARVHSSIGWGDVWGGYVKAVTFGGIVCTVCCHKGYFTHLQQNLVGPEGVSNSTTQAVVMSCVVILLADYILTSIFL
ncbi:MAG: MlaE family ABC transporter permease [Desulfovibrionaceae bacterium]